MANVFLSYDHEDIALAKPLALALEKAGHTVWYDRNIHGGAQYSRKIEQALDAADAVIVLWSERSLESAWVRDEAAEGRDRGKLVPLTMGGVTPPIGFRQFQTIEFGAWKGRGKVPQLGALLQAIESQFQQRPKRDPDAIVGTAVPPPPDEPRQRLSLWVGLAALAAASAAGGAWWWSRAGGLPVVAVVAANSSPKTQAAANDLFVKLGSLAQVGQGEWQLVDSTARSGHPDFVFRLAETDSDGRPQSNLVLLVGKSNSLLWSREFNFPAGRQADLREQQSLTAGRVLGCALESRSQGHLPADLLKIFLDSCASLTDLSGADYGPATAQLRRIVDRLPRFKPAWTRLIMAEAAAIENARFTSSYPPLMLQLRADVKRVRTIFPDLPELTLADVRLRDQVDYGRDIDSLSAAVERAPDNPQMLGELSNALQNVGRMNEAISKARRAAELDPLSPVGMTSYVISLANGGQIETARSELTKAEKLWAGTGSLRDAQINFFTRYGDPAVAMKLDPEGYNTAFYQSARADPSPSNIAKFKAGVDEFRPKSVTPDQVAWAVQGLAEFGLVDDAYYWFGRLRDDEIAHISYILFRPALASVRRDPRFMPLAKRIGLIGYWRKSGNWPDFCARPGISYDCKAEAAKLG